MRFTRVGGHSVGGVISVAENLRETAGQAEHKALVLWLPVLVFVAVGFEHCVANMALFSLAILDGTAGFGDLGRSLLFTVPGNIVGGGALVACTYWFTGRPDRASDSSYE